MTTSFPPRLAAIVIALAVLGPPWPVAARRTPSVLVEIATRGGAEVPRSPEDEAFAVELVIRSDGSFDANGTSGRLAPERLAEIRRAANRARLVLDTRMMPRCAALPTATKRVRTARGAILYRVPCGEPPHPSVLALVELATAAVRPASPTPTPEPPPTSAPAAGEVLFRYRRDSMRSLEGGERLVVFADGRVEDARGGGHLPPDGLAALRADVAHVVLGPVPRERRQECAAALEGEAEIEIPGRGSFRWQVPCGQPHESIGALLAHARSLVARP